ncbi:partial putative RNA methyltransferase, partial [Patescibacteria group bacterium]
MTSKELEHLLASKTNEFRLNNKDKLVEPSKFANQIGSTQLENIPYVKQLEIKKEALLSLFKNIVQEDILSDFDIISSPKITEYRFKAEFVASFNPKFEPINRLGQRKKGNFNWVIDLDEYILIDKAIFNKIRRVYDYSLSLGLNSYDLKKQIGDLRYLTVKHYQDQSMLIITSYNKDKRFNEVIDFAIKQGFNSVYWLVNNSLHDSFEGKISKFEGQEYLKINIHFNNKIFMFLAGPFTFFQNNIFGFQKLLEYIDSILIKFNTAQLNLYDLYCGVGVLGISLANKFKSVK